MKLIVTIDVEEDSGPDWISPPTSSFRGVTNGLKDVLQPLFRSLGVKPSLMISPIVMQDRESVDVLSALDNVELGAHLHWEQLGPHQERSVKGGPQRLEHMQWDFPVEAERRKLEVLTELFKQQFGIHPTSFRAGRYGASRATGALLKELGYLVDTSATPHVNWQTPGGGVVDYSRVPENPYLIGDSGDLFQHGQFDLLEVPITIMAQDQFPGCTQAPWLRPTYASVETMKEMIRIVRSRNAQGIEQPLVMMFHNVEVIPGASPYTQTESDVQAYLKDLRDVLSYAIQLGFEPCTLSEYARSYRLHAEISCHTHALHQASLNEGASLQTKIGIPFHDVQNVVDRHGVPHWHPFVYKVRDTRWEVQKLSQWVNANLPQDAALLSVGCGMAFNLYEWARQGFSNLQGFDCDENTIAASKELVAKYKLPIRLWVDQAQNGDHGFNESFDYIEAMNCLMYEDNMYPRFMKAYVKALKPGGIIALDVIDEAYNQVPTNYWLTSDLHKPVLERKPSEYKTRWARQQIIDLATHHGLALVTTITETQTVPRTIYIFRKPFDSATVEAPSATSARTSRKPRILFSVDIEGWAHDFKSSNLIKHLSPRFDCRKRFETNISREDFEWADIIIVYYWPQFGALQPFYDILQRKIVLTGISCPTDLEGDRHEIGLKILNSFHGVFVHNQMLHDEYGPQITKPFFLNQNGVDTNFYCPGPEREASGDLIVGWAGSLANHGNKRGYHDIILPAVAMTPGVVLQTAAREDKWRGPIEMLEFYRSLDVYLVASRVEGTPNPGLESAACGVPVISTRVGNMPELIRNGENGFLIDERTPEAFSARLAQLRDDRALLHRMSTQMRQDILAWDWAAMAKKYEAMIDQTLARLKH